MLPVVRCLPGQRPIASGTSDLNGSDAASLTLPLHTGDDEDMVPGLTSASGGDEAEAPVQQARGSRWLSQGDDEDADGGCHPK